MRLVLATMLWIITTIALAVAIPAAWAQKNVVDRAGYAAFAASAARDPQLQRAVAAELTDHVVSLAAQKGTDVSPDLVRGVATAYTMSPTFPGQFAQANGTVHRWMFGDTGQSDDDGRWVIDLAPMLSDSSFRHTLNSFNVEVPQSVSVPLTENAPDALRPGRLRPLASWGPWLSVGATVLCGVFALLTVAAARARGKALAMLGISALLVGAAGWAGLELARGRIDGALDRTAADIRGIADAMVGHAVGSLHQWLTLTLAAGGVLVVFGAIVSILGGLRRRE